MLYILYIFSGAYGDVRSGYAGYACTYWPGRIGPLTDLLRHWVLICIQFKGVVGDFQSIARVFSVVFPDC